MPPHPARYRSHKLLARGQGHWPRTHYQPHLPHTRIMMHQGPGLTVWCRATSASQPTSQSVSDVCVNCCGATDGTLNGTSCSNHTPPPPPFHCLSQCFHRCLYELCNAIQPLPLEIGGGWGSAVGRDSPTQLPNPHLDWSWRVSNLALHEGVDSFASFASAKRGMGPSPEGLIPSVPGVQLRKDNPHIYEARQQAT